MVTLKSAEGSSTIKLYSYSTKSSGLYIEFQNGGCYVYHAVPKSLFDAFEAAESRGTFHSKNIRNNYAFNKIASFEDFQRLANDYATELRSFDWRTEIEGEDCCL